MNALDLAATGAGGNLLILDTRRVDPSEHLYLSLWFRHAGVIPQCARNGSGVLYSTVSVYCELD